MAYVKRNYLGEMAVHFYDLNGTVHAVECSLSDYDALALQGAGAPALPNGAVWIHSIKRPKFDTADGTLGEGEYGASGDGMCWIRPVGGTEVLVKETDVVSDEPNQQALDDISVQTKETAVMIAVEQP